MNAAETSRGTVRFPVVDSARVLAAVAVLLIHFWPRSREEGPARLGLWVCGLSRFAVPFFFAASGRFLSKRMDDLGRCAPVAWRWTRVVLLWQAVHVLWFYLHDALEGSFSPFPPWLGRQLGFTGLFEGPAWHLWYLHSLVFTVLVTAGLGPRLRPLAWTIAVSLFVWALSVGPWKAVLGNLGLPPWPFVFNPRGFVFTSWLPFLWGAAIPSNPRMATGISIFAVGTAILSLEIAFLPADPLFPPDYLLGGAVAGCGLLHVALACGTRSVPLAAAGAAALPMYLLQYLLFSPMRRIPEPFLRMVSRDPWSVSAGAVLLAIPPFVAACWWIGERAWWKRISA